MISDVEYIAERRIKSVISDSISDTLFAIDTEKADGLITEDIRRYAFGATLVEGEYPAVSIMALRETPFRDEEDWRISGFTYDIEVIAIGDDAEQLERKCVRYGRALKNILWDAYPSIGTIQNVDYPPVFSRGTVLYKGVAVMFRLLVRENKTD